MAKTPRINSRLRKALKEVKKPQSGWIDESYKVVGTADGTILTGIPGMIYVRDIQNGQVLTVYNSVAPTDRPGLFVRVGRLVGENIYRVKGMRDSHGVPAGGGQISPHSHHDLFISRERFLPFLVLPIDGEGHTVQIYGDLIIKSDNTIGWIENQTLDLSSYVPSVGAKYVLIEADDDGVINVVDGTEVDAKELLTPVDIPAITSGSKASCAVRLFGGQEQLYRDPNSINDFVDVRSLTSGGGGGGYTPPATTAANDFQVGDGSGNWIKKTLAQTVTILQTLLDSVYAAIGHSHSGLVTNGDSHDHNGGDGAQVSYLNLSNLPAIVPYSIGGRLTLVTATPVMTTTQAGKTTIYWTPYLGQIVPIYDGTNMVPTDVGGELSQATTDNTKSPAAVASNANYDLFVWNDGGTYRCTRGPAWSTAETRGTGAGTTELERVKGILLNKVSITNGPAAQRGTYVGTVRSNGSSQIDFIFAGAASGGTAGVIGIWNMYNRLDLEMSEHDTATSWTFSSATAGPLNPGGTGSGLNNRISYVIGWAEDSIDIRMYCRGRTAAVNGAFHLHGIGLDSTTVLSATGTILTLSAVSIEGNAPCFLAVNGQLGFHYAQMLQDGDGTNTSTMFGGSNQNGLILKGRF